VCGIEFFDRAFRKCPVHWTYHPFKIRPGQPTKKSFQQMPGCEIMLSLFVCRWLLIDSSKNIHKRMQNFKGFEKENVDHDMLLEIMATQRKITSSGWGSSSYMDGSN
jgi:hypothetical protein